jgi:DNA-binding transcriptional MocR family regulator
MLLININRASATPAYRQVCDRIAALADEGALQPGDRLPATRTLAATIGLHRSSVVRAYSELRALGYLESRGGSYTTIRRRQRPPTTQAGTGFQDTDSLIDWNAATRSSIRSLHSLPAMDTPETAHGNDVINFDRLSADPILAPDDDLRRCIKHLLVRSRGEALDYADPAGWGPLREVIAARMCNHGAAVSSDEVLITAGAQQALDLVLRYLASPGDSAVVEAPTYGMAHALLKLHQLEPIEVPLLENGMDLGQLQGVLQHRQPAPKFIFTMPNFHNPTGITTDQQHRERLLELCETYRIPLLEDGFEEEMKYFGQAVLPVKSMDVKGIVLYVGTFSKVVFPGLRIGWVAAPRVAIRHLCNIMRASCISGNTLAQAAASKYCTSGEFETYLRRIHRVYRKRMRTMLQALEQHMPGGVKWTRPSGGYTAWLTLPKMKMADDDLAKTILAEGVRVGPGNRYFAGPVTTTHLRLSIACVTEQQIERGCQLLGQALSKSLA